MRTVDYQQQKASTFSAAAGRLEASTFLVPLVAHPVFSQFLMTYYSCHMKEYSFLVLK
jgi:hypothetical protein